MALVLLGLLLGLIVGYTYISRRSQSKFLASTEYWVYTYGEEMPAQEKLLDRIVGKNPYAKRGRTPIGPAEGLILSDIRLHMALVLRRKNSHVFRPDLLADLDVSAEHLRALAGSNAMIKIRYVSEEPLKDKRHLQFLIHAADAMADITESNLIYDLTGSKLYGKKELEAVLQQEVDAARPEAHVFTKWRDLPGQCYAETYGLRKIGLDELKTAPMEPDQKILVMEVLEKAIAKLWEMPTLPEEVEVEAFDDTFRLLIGPVKDGYASARIMRVQSL